MALPVFAPDCDVDTVADPYELGLDVPLLSRIGDRLRPGTAALNLTRDRWYAYEVLALADFRVPATAPVFTPADIAGFAAHHGWPVILLPRRTGHARDRLVHRITSRLARLLSEGPSPRRTKDGDPDWLVRPYQPAAKAWSVTVTSSPDGYLTNVAIDPAATGRLLGAAAAPAPVLSPADADRALAVAKSLIDGIDATGMVTVTLAFGSHREPEIEDIALGPGTPSDPDGAFLERGALHLLALLDRL